MICAVAPVGERLEAYTPFIECAKKRHEKSYLELQKIQAERARLAAELAKGQVRLEALRTEAGSAAPTQPAAPVDVGAELKRMQAVIDDLLRERSRWKGSRHVGSTGVVEGTIPMDVGTLVDNRSARMEALIHEAGNKLLRVEPLQSQLKRGPRAWIPHPELHHLEVRSPEIWLREGLTQRALQEFPSKGMALRCPAEALVDFVPRATHYSEALASLDGVTLKDVSDTRAVVMHSIPFFLRSAFKRALKVSLQAIIRRYEQHSDLRITRGWKFFMSFTHLLLFRRRR